MARDRRFYFEAKVAAKLANGETVVETIDSYVEDVNEAAARQSYKSAVTEIVFDWGSDKVDAPVESVEILNSRWFGEKAPR